MRRKLLVTINVAFDAIDRLLIRCFTFAKYLRKNGKYSEEVHQLFIDFKKAYDSIRREILYKIFIEFGIPRKLVKVNKDESD